MLCSSLDGGGVWGRIDTCIYMAESSCCRSETSTKLSISQYKIKKFLKIQMNILCTKMCDTVRVVKRYVSLIAIH